MIRGASQNRMDRMFRSLKKSPLLKPQIRKAIHSTLPGKVLENALYCRRHCNMSQTSQDRKPEDSSLYDQNCVAAVGPVLLVKLSYKQYFLLNSRNLDVTQHHHVSRTDPHFAVSVP